MEDTTKRCPFRQNLNPQGEIWPKCLWSGL